MNILKDKIFITLFIFGCAVRFALALLPGQIFDIQYWSDWSIKLAEVGPGGFYGLTERTDYMPGYLYILWLLGSLKNIFLIDQQTFLYLLKVPGIVAEVLISVIIYFYFSNYSYKLKNLASGAILLNPALIFNSAIWGQIDSILTLMMLFTITFISQNKFLLSSLFLSLSFLVKPQTLSIILIPALALVKNLSSRNIIKLIIPPVVVIYLVSLPFFPDNTLVNLFNLLNNTANQYAYNSLSAFNFWGLMGFWQDDNQLLLGLSFKNWGILALGIYWIIILYFYFKNKLSFFTLATLATLGFYFLPTRVHERYLYPALVFLIITSIQFKNMKVFYLSLILSLFHLLNLIYVYTMYNPNAPRQVYQFLSENTTLFTIVSGGLFIIISCILLKNEYSKHS